MTGLAAAVFVAVSAPADFFGVTSPSKGLLHRAGAIAAAVVFVAAVATILLRHHRAAEDLARRRRASAQPSQPGRTRPDS